MIVINDSFGAFASDRKLSEFKKQKTISEG